MDENELTTAESGETEAAVSESDTDTSALEACKAYMRVDGTDDDDLIGSLMDVAKAYLAAAGIEEPETESPRYTLAVHALTLHYYDHRDSVGGETPFPSGLRPFINQMKHEADYPL